jgi:hypothetical protein
LLDQVRGEGLPGRLLVADADHSASRPFREALASRGPHSIVSGTDEMLVFTEEPAWVAPGPAARPSKSGGRPRKRPRLKEGIPRPVSLGALAAKTPLRKVIWREGAKGKLSGRFAWLRVWPGGGWATGDCAGAEPVWLLIEEQADGEIQIRPLEPAGPHQSDQGGPAVEEPLAGATRLPADEGGIGAGPSRGAFLARVPPPRLPGDVGLRIPGVGARA